MRNMAVQYGKNNFLRDPTDLEETNMPHYE